MSRSPSFTTWIFSCVFLGHRKLASSRGANFSPTFLNGPCGRKLKQASLVVGAPEGRS